ncbi:hypothetical protein J437_LFUL000245 [Ladona fulva]|uniref:Gelsolin-like domain-containing protein n=1 Tax=Ladona fulva TaxID=123851 RepID=A0A8K0NSD8_LADFU|nr:hypothetical protein J437_LFUL000245 [Ladona fulva]
MSTPPAAVDPAFKVVPKTSSAFFIWRIENMTVVPMPKDEYGKFYDGDSYIVYAASERGKPAGPDIKVGRIARLPSVTQNFDATVMHERPSLAAEMQMVDDGSGKKIVWRVENMSLVPVPEDTYGIFYDGDAYIVQYSYSPPGSNTERHILYFWLGLHCSKDEAGAAALLTVQKDDEEFDGAAVQVRVVQEKEPPHFLVLFAGKAIVLRGGKASKFDGDEAKIINHTPDRYLLQVHGNERYNTRATEVAEVRNASLEVHIHFWLGLETSQDEAGVAAYKTVELDDYLGGGPTQHREVQGMESPRFRSYFRNGIMLLHGGVASGLRRSLQDAESFRSRLFRVRGRRWSNTSVCQMPSIAWENMNSGDAFVLETWPAIFVWTGKTASHMEKVQAAKVAQQLREERPAQGVDPTSGKMMNNNVIPIVFVEDGKEGTLGDTEKRVFEALLPLKKRSTIKKAEEVIDEKEEEDGETKAKEILKLYHCSDEGGTLKVTEVKDGPLFQDDLDSKDSFIVDSGPTRGIWVWVGKGASNKERVEAMRNAHGFVRKKEYPSHTPVTRVIDGAEPLEFRCLFKKWKIPNLVAPGTPFKSPTGKFSSPVTKIFVLVKCYIIYVFI